MTDMDAAERTSQGHAIALACAGVLDAGLTSEGATEIVKIIDKIKAEANENGRQAGLEEAAVLLDGKPAIYPTSVFLEPPAGEHGKTVDGCSAAALRKTAPRWAGEVRALKDKPEGGQ